MSAKNTINFSLFFPPLLVPYFQTSQVIQIALKMFLGPPFAKNDFPSHTGLTLCLFFIVVWYPTIFLRSSRIGVDLVSYESKLTDKRKQYDWMPGKKFERVFCLYFCYLIPSINESFNSVPASHFASFKPIQKI